MIKKYDTFIDKGMLIPISLKTLPFAPRRVFFISNVPSGTIRGNHAHRANEQVLICLSGRLDLCVINGSAGVCQLIELYPGDSFHHLPFEWVKITFVEDNSTLFSFCSEEYDESDYIRDYNEFLDIIESQQQQSL